ncbi:MAG: hypothetical protein JO056_11580 [Alphaproteobacteria bacterium]|nr:hypothetical protein [Alphaproteobacteria bacterium]
MIAIPRRIAGRQISPSSLSRRVLRASACVAALSCIGVGLAEAKNFDVLYAFCAKSGCVDGKEPMAPLVSDSHGNLYGTTFGGGSAGSGTVFALVPSADGSKWTHKVLYNFCTAEACSDGEFPNPGALAIDSQGNLYGTVPSGGRSGGGIAYKLTPGKRTDAPWTLSVLHDFCGSDSCSDGSMPWAGLTYRGAAEGLPYDGTSPLYGTTFVGGSTGYGTAYSLTPKGKSWREQVLYTFCTQASCTDGGEPDAPLTVDSDGNVYGTTSEFGPNYAGTAFQLRKQNKHWKANVLYAFCAAANCSDGKQPSVGGLVIDASGALYGTTSRGGSQDGGTAFKLVRHGAHSDASVLHSFCVQQNCSDGALPDSALWLEPTGKLYGTLASGGVHFGGYAGGAGGVYSLDGGSMHALHMFCSQTDCRDGARPMAGLIPVKGGQLVGTASAGGPHNAGVVFAVKP